MQIVIDIPDNMQEMCRWHQDCVCNLTSLEVDILAETVRNGIVLPKNHGRLIDASQLYTVTTYDADDNHEICYVLYEDIENAPTILEAEVEHDD